MNPRIFLVKVCLEPLNSRDFLPLSEHQSNSLFELFSQKTSKFEAMFMSKIVNWTPKQHYFIVQLPYSPSSREWHHCLANPRFSSLLELFQYTWLENSLVYHNCYQKLNCPQLSVIQQLFWTATICYPTCTVVRSLRNKLLSVNQLSVIQQIIVHNRLLPTKSPQSE